MDTLETRDATALAVATLQLDAATATARAAAAAAMATDKGDECDGIGTSRGRLLSGLKNGLVFHHPLSFPLPSLSLYSAISRSVSLLHFSCIQRPPTIREIEKALVRERVKSVEHRSTHRACWIHFYSSLSNIVK